MASGDDKDSDDPDPGKKRRKEDKKKVTDINKEAVGNFIQRVCARFERFRAISRLLEEPDEPEQKNVRRKIKKPRKMTSDVIQYLCEDQPSTSGLHQTEKEYRSMLKKHKSADSSGKKSDKKKVIYRQQLEESSTEITDISLGTPKQSDDYPTDALIELSKFDEQLIIDDPNEPSSSSSGAFWKNKKGSQLLSDINKPSSSSSNIGKQAEDIDDTTAALKPKQKQFGMYISQKKSEQQKRHSDDVDIAESFAQKVVITHPKQATKHTKNEKTTSAKTTPTKTTPTRTTPTRTTPIKATPIKATPIKATPTKATPTTATPTTATPTTATPTTATARKTMPTKTTPTRTTTEQESTDEYYGIGPSKKFRRKRDDEEEDEEERKE